MNKYNIFGEQYQDLAKDIYEGIYRAHPEISEELADEYANIAFYMISKNKTEMRIHAPKMSKRRFEQLLQRLKETRETEKKTNSNIISFEEIQRKFTK